MAIGKLTRPHGVRGELRLVPNTGDLEFPNLRAEAVQLTSENGEVRCLNVESFRKASDVFLVRFADILDRTAAEAFVGATVAIDVTRLPSAGSSAFYLFELQGAVVVDEKQQHIGTVHELFHNNGQDLVHIQTDRGLCLFPMVPQTIVEFHREERRLVIRPIAGLWDILLP